MSWAEDKETHAFSLAQSQLICPVVVDQILVNASLSVLTEARFILGEPSITEYTLSIAFMNVIFALAIVTLILLRKKNEIYQRNLGLVLVTAFCSVISTNYAVICLKPFQHIYAKIPCIVEVWVTLLILPMMLVCYFLRALFLLAKFRFNRDALVSLMASEKRFPFLLTKFFRFILRRGGKNPLSTVNTIGQSTTITSTETPQELARRRKKARVGLDRILKLLFGTVLAVCLVVIIYIHSTYEGMGFMRIEYPKYVLHRDISEYYEVDYWRNHADFHCLTGCLVVTTALLYYMIPFHVFVILLMLYIIWSLRLVYDDLYIKQEIMVYTIVVIPLIVSEIASIYLEAMTTGDLALQFLNATQNDVDKSTGFEALIKATRIFRVLLGLLSFAGSVIFPIILCIWRRYHTPDLDFNDASFNLLLTDSRQFKLYKEFLSHQLCVESALFFEEYWRLCRQIIPNLQSAVPKSMNEQLTKHVAEHQIVPFATQKELHRLYADFIRDNAPYQLNIPFLTRRDVKVALEKPHPHPIAFMCAWREVYWLLFTNTFSVYLARKKVAVTPRMSVS
jgi:hypothetical protein